MNAATIEKPVANKLAIANKPVDKSQVVLPKINSISLETYAAAMTESFASARYSINLEMSICLSVYLENGKVNNDSKRTLQDIYTLAGWGEDQYKTIQRRANVAGLLFTHYSKDVLEKIVEGKMGSQRLSALVGFIATDNHSTIDGILRFTGNPRKAPVHQELSKKDVVEKKRVLNTAEFQQINKDFQESQNEGTFSGRVTADDDVAEDAVLYATWLRKSKDVPLAMKQDWFLGARHINTPHLLLSIKLEANRDEIIKVAMDLLAIASQMEQQMAETFGDVVPDAHHGNVQAEPEKTDAELDAEAEKAVIAAQHQQALPMKKTHPSRFRKPTSRADVGNTALAVQR